LNGGGGVLGWGGRRDFAEEYLENISPVAVSGNKSIPDFLLVLIFSAGRAPVYIFVHALHLYSLTCGGEEIC
jgi:hypothetical protein